MNVSIRPILTTSVISLIFMAFIVFSCGTTSDKRDVIDGRVAVVLDAGPGVEIHRDSKTIQAKAGFVIRKGDVIKTTLSVTDIQTIRGDIIRVGQYSSITASTFGYGESGKTEGTEMMLNAGNILAEVGKNSPSEGFRIRTPTAIASVRGTAFKVELVDGKTPSIKVYKGAVAVKPNVNIMEDLSKKDIASNKSLNKIAGLLDKYEVVLEEANEITYKPDAAELIFLINTTLTKEDFEKGVNPLKKLNESNISLDKLEHIDIGKVKAARITPQEKANLATMVEVETDLIIKAIESDVALKEGKETEVASEIAQKIEIAQTAALDKALENVTKSAESENLKTEEELKNYYNVLEVVVKNDGSKLSGAIVTQAKDTLIMHTTEGVKKVKRNDIDYVDFYDYTIDMNKKSKVQ